MQERKDFRFYKEWLPLPKEQFRILLFLTRFGSFSGNLSDLCRYFSLSPQNKNRNKVRESIEALDMSGMISCEKEGRTYNLKLIPKEKGIDMPCAWVDKFTSTPFSASVSVEVLIKVLLWFLDNGNAMFKNADIAEALNISTTTIVVAKKVLINDFKAIKINYVTTKISDGVYHHEGETVDVCAWI